MSCESTQNLARKQCAFGPDSVCFISLAFCNPTAVFSLQELCNKFKQANKENVQDEYTT
jgi:hypothetical protein